MTEEEFFAYQSKVIGKILESPLEEALQIYTNNFNVLQNYSFILPYSEGIDYVQKFREMKLKNIDVIHFFQSDRLYCLNAQDCISNLFNHEYENKIASCVSLDTQIQSYLYRNYIDAKNKIPENIEEIQKLIDSRMCLIDCLPYTFENTLFNPQFIKMQIYKDNVFAFETYFLKNKQKAKIYSNKLIKYDKRLMDDEFSDWYRRQYLFYYLELLVMIDIFLNHKNLKIFDKELLLVKYFHENIGLLSDRELNLAKLLFIHGTKITFFGKIQKGRKDIVKNLRNMAWDIFHLNNIFNGMLIPRKGIDFVIPFFITYDRRLKDIAPIYKLKSIAYIPGGFIKHLYFLTDLLDPTIKHNYFTAKAFLDRQSRLKGVTEKILIDKIQIEIDKYEELLS
ncbi:MAG: hypothetical protein J1F69_03305 [Clostridiales bacterium]|nr:hypothetical protein [Clostridiales bacterium]